MIWIVREDGRIAKAEFETKPGRDPRRMLVEAYPELAGLACGLDGCLVLRAGPEDAPTLKTIIDVELWVSECWRASYVEVRAEGAEPRRMYARNPQEAVDEARARWALRTVKVAGVSAYVNRMQVWDSSHARELTVAEFSGIERVKDTARVRRTMGGTQSVNFFEAADGGLVTMGGVNEKDGRFTPMHIFLEGLRRHRCIQETPCPDGRFHVFPPPGPLSHPAPAPTFGHLPRGH